MDRRRSLGSGLGSKTQLEMWQTDPLAARIACVWLPRFGLRVASSRDPLRSPTERRSSSRSPDDAASPSPDGDDESETETTPVVMTALYRPGTRWQELLEVSPDLEALGIRVDQPLR